MRENATFYDTNFGIKFFFSNCFVASGDARPEWINIQCSLPGQNRSKYSIGCQARTDQSTKQVAGPEWIKVQYRLPGQNGSNSSVDCQARTDQSTMQVAGPEWISVVCLARTDQKIVQVANLYVLYVQYCLCCTNILPTKVLIIC